LWFVLGWDAAAVVDVDWFVLGLENVNVTINHQTQPNPTQTNG
jgi:hypothetical protein